VRAVLKLRGVCSYLPSENESLKCRAKINLKFFVKLGKSANETCAVLFEAYCAKSMKKPHVLMWHKWFKKSGEDVEDIERNGHPKMYRSSENTGEVQTLFCSEQANCQLGLLHRSTGGFI
jgi:hypothetical protein